MRFTCLNLFCAIAVAQTNPLDNATIFDRLVRPVIQKSCAPCHGGPTLSGGLDLSSWNSVLAGGKHGPAVIPGDAKHSLLVQYIKGEVTPKMPVGGSLDPTVIESLASAIGGMKALPATTSKKNSYLNWLLHKPANPSVPSVQNVGWVKNSIDAFILAKLEVKQLHPAPEASKRALLRRVYFDLTGLPPTPDEIRAFESDPDPAAYEKIVDKLLASPRYGERWGRHWLDLARFAESDGFAIDGERPNAWRYRDYVIRSFNQDKHYDEFVKEQIAGDEMQGGDRSERLVALGFLRMETWEGDANFKTQLRQDVLNELTGTVGQVFLGYTVGCARCHDHKYDPIPQRDFYRLQALFAPTRVENREAPFRESEHPKLMRANLRRFEDQSDEANEALNKLEAQLKQKYVALGKSGEDGKKSDFMKALTDMKDPSFTSAERKEWHEAQNQARKLTESVARYRAFAYSVSDVIPPQVPTLAETFVLAGGELANKGEKVEPGFLQAVAGNGDPAKIPFAGGSSGRRTALADWIASPENPLTVQPPPVRPAKREYLIRRCGFYHLSLHQHAPTPGRPENRFLITNMNKIPRRQFIKSATAAAASLASWPSPSRAAEAPRPNIVFILCDDLGFGDIGATYQNQRAALHDRGVPFFSTPNIDTLAKEGAMLTQHYSGAPVCAPSRTSLLSGLTQGHANVRDNEFDKALADSHTLGTVLQQAGYATAAIGKWGLQGGDWQNPQNKSPSIDAPAAQKTATYQTWNAFPTKRGFDYFFGYVRHQDGHFHYPKEDGREVWQNDREIASDLDKCYTTDLWTAQTKKWITDQTKTNPANPFFVYLAYDTPHAKLQNPPCPYPAGGGLTGGVQWTGKPHAMLNTATGTVDSDMFPDYATATWDHDHDPATPEVPWPDVQQRYANDVRRIDSGVGDILQLLKDLKIDDNTLVIFTSDNGPSIESYLDKEPYAPTFFRGYGPFDGIKRDTLEGGMREPTLARWPKMIPAGRLATQPSGQWDWLATFAEAAGVPAPAASDGVSLLPSLTGRGNQRASTIYLEYFQNQNTPNFADFNPAHRGRKRGQMQNIFLHGYMGVRYNVKSANDDFEIYDLASDQQEVHNLAKDLVHLQSAMKARVLQVRVPNASTPRPYDNTPVPPVAMTPKGAPGLTYSTFTGVWPWLPDFRTLTPTKRGHTKMIGLAMPTGNKPFGISFEGYFYAAQPSEYTFTLGSDTGAMLFLHDIRLIAEPLKGAAGTFTGTVRLNTGWHPIRLYYRHAGTAKPSLELSCQQGASTPYNLTPEVFRPFLKEA